MCPSKPMCLDAEGPLTRDPLKSLRFASRILGIMEFRIRVLVPRPEWGQRRGAAAALTSLVAPRQGPMAGVLV